MNFRIKHEIRGRMRIQTIQRKMSFREADTLQYYLELLPFVQSVKVSERTGDAVIYHDGDRDALISALQAFSYEKTEVPKLIMECSNRELNAEYWEKLVWKVIMRLLRRVFVPFSVRRVCTTARAIKYVQKGMRCLCHRRIEVPVLDGVAVGLSVCRGDFKTAGSVMFLLEIGELLEEWSHKKAVDDLARSMSIHAGKVWAVVDEQEILTAAEDIQLGDIVAVRMGTVIPFDGTVIYGEAMVNQSTLTGESEPVRKVDGSYVYAGTVLEEGEIRLQVKAVDGASKFDKIVSMIEETEKMKSALESKAEHLADQLVPYTFAASALTGLLSGNISKAISVLMVDFSCALKLAMPIAVLSAIRELNDYHVVVKGGKFLEAVAQADTLVFDKTGTLTKAEPTVVDVISFCDKSKEEMLKLAACLEEHFPHSMAKAVVEAARVRKLEHEEMHSKVDYIVAHGIATIVGEKRVIIGSKHFVFEDEQCVVPDEKQEMFDTLPEQYSHLYLAIEGVLSAVICVEDPLREEAFTIVNALKEVGITKVIMMTGDSERTASVIARRVGVDEYHAEVLPEEKAEYIMQEKAMGRTVMMVGDGINDSPALSAANVGIAISDGAELARQIADITIAGNDLKELITLKKVSNALMRRIKSNYHSIVGINSGLIGLGIIGILPPTTSALLHNTSTLAISAKSMKKLI